MVSACLVKITYQLPRNVYQYNLPVETIVCDRPQTICFTLSGFKPIKMFSIIFFALTKDSVHTFNTTRFINIFHMSQAKLSKTIFSKTKNSSVFYKKKTCFQSHIIIQQRNNIIVYSSNNNVGMCVCFCPLLFIFF